ncbi:MAG: hypothetical protein ACLQJR_23295 [Stellaceae bacterium]
MAIAWSEDAPRAPQAAQIAYLPPVGIGVKKLAIWIVAASVPWVIIIGTVRLVVAALS